MAVIFKDKTMYDGAVLKTYEHYWMDGMLSERAICWDSEKQDTVEIEFGYYGIDGTNLAGGACEIDATPDTWREIIRWLKPKAYSAFAKSVTDYKRGIRVGTHAKVVRGKKVQKGTMVEVFWIGERKTYKSRQYHWMHETETVAGCYDADGNKLWIKAEYLQNTDPIKSPNAKERKKFVREYIDDHARKLGAPWAKRR